MVIRVCRDEVDHPGESVAWGRWAITSNDPDFRGKGAQDSGEDYGPAPGASVPHVCSLIVLKEARRSVCREREVLWSH